MEEGSEEERLALIQKVEEHRGQLAAAQRQFRQANVRQMGVLENQSSRDLLNTSNGQVVRRKKDKQEMVEAHGGVTRSLQAISSQVVGDTGTEYSSMGGFIGQSKKLITKYG